MNTNNSAVRNSSDSYTFPSSCSKHDSKHKKHEDNLCKADEIEPENRLRRRQSQKRVFRVKRTAARIRPASPSITWRTKYFQFFFLGLFLKLVHRWRFRRTALPTPRSRGKRRYCGGWRVRVLSYDVEIFGSKWGLL